MFKMVEVLIHDRKELYGWRLKSVLWMLQRLQDKIYGKPMQLGFETLRGQVYSIRHELNVIWLYAHGWNYVPWWGGGGSGEAYMKTLNAAYAERRFNGSQKRPGTMTIKELKLAFKEV